jgi:hypothetical protein
MTEAMDRFGQTSLTAATAVAKLRQELHLDEGAMQGWNAGVREYLVSGENAFTTWKNTALSVLRGVENAFTQGITGILSGQMSLSQGLKAIWQGIVQALAQAVAQMIARWILLKIAGAALTTSEVAQSGIKQAAYLQEGAPGAWAAYGWMPFVGAGLALAQIAMMEASVAAAGLAAGGLSTKGVAPAGDTGMTLNAEGGYYTRPTVGLFGEAGPELVAPAVKFQDFAANLSANILARERQAQAYGRQAAGYARAGAAGGGSAPVHIENHYPQTAPNWGADDRGLYEAGRFFYKANQAYAQRAGQGLDASQPYGARL